MGVFVGSVAVHRSRFTHRVTTDDAYRPTIQPSETCDEATCIKLSHLEKVAVVDDMTYEGPSVVALSAIRGNEIQ